MIEQPVEAVEFIQPSVTTDLQNQQLAELKDLTRSLMGSIKEMQAQSARNTVFADTMADLKAMSRTMLLAPTKTTVAAADGRDCCGEQPCGCVGTNCCCFEIVLSKVRATKPQSPLEPADMGDIPGLINALEVQIYVTVEDTGFLWPGLATTMDLRANGMPGGPGPWVVIERVVNRVYVKKGTTKTTELKAEVREHDEGAERPIGFKDELGEASGLITLYCCMEKIYPPMPIDVNLIHGGEAGGVVTLVFYARRVCC